MDRRQFIGIAVGTPIVLLLGSQLGAILRRYPLQELSTQLQHLPLHQLRSTGSWSVSEIFQHCAQSIRYSRVGYPEQRSALFKYTVGAVALGAFSSIGRMHHPLDEALPGAPALKAEVPLDVAQAELVVELELFIAWQGELAPHFAYGRLSKAQYYNAHWLHLQNHLQEVVLV
ncbi:DUF1569 domain-containing protein [Alkalimonas collagenimarina]|uniref:DUF1569 domain-containing protein n=1 Tax=Alkalimonas collagenimarina TaxID=400390 RepID=A0ABT9H167_9GAMM|nr:DUF1569 domain-containing protein [Alkalimonas collagenimarina]MDP4537028.1 DUF1569 domain-containing protein [Alkalimonas collagenimarina]